MSNAPFVPLPGLDHAQAFRAAHRILPRGTAFLDALEQGRAES